MRFVQTGFDGLTSFNNYLFKGNAIYRAAQVSRTFLLSGARFEQAPDFIQTRFEEAPRLDDIHIKKSQRFRVARLDGIRALFRSGAGPAIFWRAGLASVKALFKGDASLAARWRALKKLAVAAHHHNSELRFFKEEVLARRWLVDKPWHALFYFGLLYELLSDFGRSVLRPLLGWVLGLSLRNALVLPGGGSVTRLDQIYACLYGIYGNTAAAYARPPTPLPACFQPVIPNAVALADVAQNLWSAIMLFLLLLALRNHFRIK